MARLARPGPANAEGPVAIVATMRGTVKTWRPTGPIGIGADPLRSGPSHTTRHAGPHRAVRVVEVSTDGERRGFQSTPGQAPD